MNQDQLFNSIAQRLDQLLPPGLSNLKDELQKNVKSMLKEGFSKMNVVTREEFEIQSEVLAKTRAKVDKLERQVKALEAQINLEI